MNNIEYNGENVKAVLTFGNGLVYIAEQNNISDRIIKRWAKDKKENNTAGNPLGIPQSGTISLQIIDYNDLLVLTNEQSPYHGYLKENVKIEMFRLKDDEWIPFGVYYTDGWASSVEYGKGYLTNISGRDIITHISMLEIPKLPAFASIKATDVLNYLLQGCGLTTDQYEIDDGIDLNIPYLIKKGKYMGYILKELCNALISVIVSDDTGKIIIKRAFLQSGKSLGVVDAGMLLNMQIRENGDKIYDAVKVTYSSVAVGVSRKLSEILGYTIKSGDDFIDNIEIPDNTIGIDGVSFKYKIDKDTTCKLDSVSYQGFQGGLTVQTVNKGEDIVTDVSIIGRTSSEATAFVYDSEHSTEVNDVNTLNINNIYIQNKTTAQKYADQVLDYLRQISHKVSIRCFFGLDVDCGKTFTIKDAETSIINGTYYITSLHIEGGTSYICNIEAIKID